MILRPALSEHEVPEALDDLAMLALACRLEAALVGVQAAGLPQMSVRLIGRARAGGCLDS